MPMNERRRSLRRVTKLLHDKILIRRLSESRKVSLLVDLVTNEREEQARGLVLMVGPGRRDPENLRERLPMTTRPGHVVVFGKYTDMEEGADVGDLAIIGEKDVRFVEGLIL